MTILSDTHDDLSSYIDDICVHTSTFERHLFALRTMLRRFIMAGITLKGSKCLILPPSLELLGFQVAPEGVQMQYKKCDQWRKFPTPSNKAEVRTFLGGVAWYRRWMDNLGTMAAPLTGELIAAIEQGDFY